MKNRSIDTLMQTDPNKTAIIWIMSDASSSQNMKLRCKKMDALPTDMGVLLPVDCALVEIITDEGTEVSAPALRMQDPVSLYETVVTATPRACIEGDINQNHWIRQVIPKETIKVIDCQSGLSQDKVREAFQGLAVLSLLTVPLPLVGMVAEEFEHDLPSGVRIMKLRTRRLSVLPQSDGQDDLSTMSLETYFHKNITGALYQVPSVRAVKQKLDRLSKGSVVSSKLIEALQQLVLECQQVSNTASLFDHNRKAANTTAGAIQRVLDNLVAADTCQICCNPVGGNNPLMMLGCVADCVGHVCSKWRRSSAHARIVGQTWTRVESSSLCMQMKRWPRRRRRILRAAIKTWWTEWKAWCSRCKSSRGGSPRTSSRFTGQCVCMRLGSSSFVRAARCSAQKTM